MRGSCGVGGGVVMLKLNGECASGYRCTDGRVNVWNRNELGWPTLRRLQCVAARKRLLFSSLASVFTPPFDAPLYSDVCLPACLPGADEERSF